MRRMRRLAVLDEESGCGLLWLVEEEVGVTYLLVQ